VVIEWVAGACGRAPGAAGAADADADTDDESDGDPAAPLSNTLVLYAYAETSARVRDNLRFFLKHGVLPAASDKCCFYMPAQWVASC